RATTSAQSRARPTIRISRALVKAWWSWPTAPSRSHGMGSENGRHRGLLVDYGGVLTSDLFDSFRSFCELEGIEPTAVGDRFRTDPVCRELLIGLETGKVPEEHFEVEFADVLGVGSGGLIDRMFAGSQPEEAMLAAVQRARTEDRRAGRAARGGVALRRRGAGFAAFVVLGALVLAGCGSQALSSGELQNQATRVCTLAAQQTNRIQTPSSPAGTAVFLRK